MGSDKQEFKCPACESLEISRANKDTGRIGYLFLLVGFLIVVLKGIHYYSLGGLLLVALAMLMIFKTGKEFNCDQCGARWT